MSRPWFKFYGRDFRDGARVLAWDEKGVYVVLLSLMYDAGGAVRDDPQDIARALGCDVRMWTRVRKRLLDLSKIRLGSDGFLRNDRVEIEEKSRRSLGEVREKSGRLGGQLSAKSRARALKSKETAEARASNLLAYARALPEPEADTPIDKPIGVSAPARAKPKRVSTEATLPAAPTEAMVRDASGRGFVNGSLATEFGKWRDYHLAHGTAIADHDASFRTWLGNALRFRSPDRPSSAASQNRPRIYPNPYQG